MSRTHTNDTLLEALQACEPVKEDTIGLVQALVAWNQILAILKDEHRRNRLQESLNPAQAHSLALLREWWDGTLLHPHRRNPARAFLYTKSFRMDHLPIIDDVDRVSVFDMPIESAHYHHWLRLLFQAEIGGEWRNEPLTMHWKTKDLIARRRRKASKYAATQRLAAQFLYTNSYPPADETSPHLIHGNPKPITATMQTCPWLTIDKKDGLPFFLWDIARRCTVRTQDLGTSANDYMCISHTWGRWPDPQGPVRIEGVPWLVLCNKIFLVTTLPQRLYDARLPTLYLWFDLLCIPQDRSKKAAEEISRQAAIFNSAKYCAVWFNTLNGWEGLLASVGYLSWHYSKYSGWRKGAGVQRQGFEIDVTNLVQLEEPDPSEAELRLRAHQPCAFMSPSSDLGGLGEISGWFTSLWTLQEFCLRPDMMLYDAEFTTLSSPAHLSIYLDDLIALVDSASDVSNVSSFQIFADDVLSYIGVDPSLPDVLEAGADISSFVRETRKDDPGFPIGPGELFFLFQKTGLENIGNLEPTMIFALGEQRQCTSRRAEAVMSVIGVTDWFQELTDSAEADGSIPERDLVLETYPLAFVREAANKIGPAFYQSMFFGPYTTHEEFQEMFPSNMQPVGSLLPFGDPHSPFTRVFVGGLENDSIGRELVASWTIMLDGSVHISEAAIVTSTLRTEPSETIWAQFVSPILDTSATGASGKMHDLLQAYHLNNSELHLYVVQLGQTSSTSQGVLLQELSTSAPKKLLQVGTWNGVLNFDSSNVKGNFTLTAAAPPHLPNGNLFPPRNPKSTHLAPKLYIVQPIPRGHVKADLRIHKKTVRFEGRGGREGHVRI
ncbi:MAG: hypothetical protein Q9213_002173 [Squamulea squamosa]